MAKGLEKFVTNLREKNPEKFVQFVHDLAHTLTLDEVEMLHEHAHDIASDVETELVNTETPNDVNREEVLAKHLEEVVAQLRNGEYKLDPRSTGVDVKIINTYED